jgi:hypothetical protein
MLYTVKYKKPQWWFWRKLKNVKGDGIVFGGSGQAIPVRYFILMDESRVELPSSMMFRFDPDRFRMIQEDMRRETGH